VCVIVHMKVSTLHTTSLMVDDKAKKGRLPDTQHDTLADTISSVPNDCRHSFQVPNESLLMIHRNLPANKTNERRQW
jgi:hypothetical protein